MVDNLDKGGGGGAAALSRSRTHFLRKQLRTTNKAPAAITPNHAANHATSYHFSDIMNYPYLFMFSTVAVLIFFFFF